MCALVEILLALILVSMVIIVTILTSKNSRALLKPPAKLKHMRQ